MPDLVSRLSSLHATLTARLVLHDRLLTLNGRLDLMLSQIELRSSKAPAIVVPKGKSKGRKGHGKSHEPLAKAPLKYVEGESSDSEAEEGMELSEEGVDIEDSEDEGSVEDIQLGGGSDTEGRGEDGDDIEEEEEDNDDDEEEEEEDSEDSRSARKSQNPFLDDEADEDWGSDEEEDDSE